ncbi:MAG: hypothetical protein KGZ74_04975 [Chitinophagaceae bacterium]|nr:hypothetical protein [Chitinophagaceae bacterium]
MMQRKAYDDGLFGDIRFDEFFFAKSNNFNVSYRVAGDARNFIADRRDDYEGSSPEEEEVFNQIFPRHIEIAKDKGRFWSVDDKGLDFNEPVFIKDLVYWILGQLKDAQTEGRQPHPWLSDN